MSPRDLRFSANVSMLFAELPFRERFAAAARAGFDAVECHFPYEFDPADLRALLSEAGIRMNGVNTPPGGPGEFGLAAMPGREGEFARAMELALRYAQALGAGTIHVMSGCPPHDAMGQAREVFLRNLEHASDMAAGSGVMLLVEPINARDRPGYFVSRSDEVAVLLRELGRENVKMMLDLYHVQIMEGDLLTRLDRHWPLIGHIQFASVPRRAEPDEGEIAWRAIFEAIAERGWRGYVAAEYRPRGATLDGLAWLAAARA